MERPASAESLREARKRTVGSKQTLKALHRDEARVVFLAKDAEERVVRELKQACKDKAVPIVYVDTMLQLGRECGIEVGAASAAILDSEV